MQHNTSTTPPKGYKKTKLGNIPNEWSTPIISEVFEFLKTTSFSRDQLNYDNESKMFYLHYGDIHATYKKPILDFEIVTNIPRLNKDISFPNSVHYLKDGDVIIADASEDYAGVGEAIEVVNLNGNKAISGLHTFALRDVNNKTVQGFRTYIFKNTNVKKALKIIATGSKVYGISKGNLQKFNIVLPTLNEQQKIVEILTIWDSAIAKQERLLKLKVKAKKGLMQLLLTGKKRFPEFKDRWEKQKMQDIVTYLGGEAFKSKDKTTFGIKWLKIANVGIGLTKWDSDTTYLPKHFKKIYSKYLLNENDVIMALTRPILNNQLKIAIIKNKDGVSLLNQRVSKLSSKGNNELIYIYIICINFHILFIQLMP